MQFLKANTQVKVVIGPAVDITDGLTPETTLDISTADEAELMKHDAASVTDISSNTWAAITSMDGYYNLTLTAGNVDTEGMMTIAIQDDSLCLPIKAEFMVLAEAAYDSMLTAKDTGYMDVNVKAVSEDTTAADNLELDYDGTGFAKTNSTIGACSVNSDMRGTDSAALASVCTEGRLAELDSANIPTDIDNLTNQIGTAGASLTDLGGMSTGMKAEVNAELVDVLTVDTQTLPGQEAPTATPTILEGVMYLYKAWRNKKTQTATEFNLFADDGSTVDQKATASDDGSTATMGEIGTGP